MLNGLDLFSGIGGISCALAPWVQTVAYCENDRYAQAVLLSRMVDRSIHHAPIWDDITTLRGTALPNIDIVTGGFPCQDISVAGHGVGLGGKRSGLYWEMLRIIEGVQPTFVFLENVPALRTRGALEVARSLAERGYDQEWDCISAREVGAPFLGERWFCVAAANSKTLRKQPWWVCGKNRKGTPFDSSNGDKGFVAESFNGSAQSRIFRAGNGVPFAVDRDRALGNAVVPLQARTAFERLMGIERREK